jgi:hypothetical protein
MEDSKLEAGARLAVTWHAQGSTRSINALDHVASYMRTLVEALSLAGWEPRRLEVDLRVTPAMIVELDVEGDVPGLDQASFAKLASVAIASCNLWQALLPEAELRLRPRLAHGAPVAAVQRQEPPPAPTTVAAPKTVEVDSGKPHVASRVIVAVVFGALLGLFGLPRLIPSFGPSTGVPASDVPVPAAIVVTLPPTPAAKLAPTPQPTLASTPTPGSTAPPTPSPAAVARTLLAARFADQPQGWPNTPGGKAWFADGKYELMARDPGSFVAIEVPLDRATGDVVLSGRFRKHGGPPGGGYGFVVRNQGSRLDGANQQGKYVVVEVGDRGDVGVWQRDETHWIDIMPWTRSDAVRQGTEPNDLLVATVGPRLRFVVNGTEVANMTDDALPAGGGVGVFVGGDLNEVSLESLTVEAAE